MAKVKIVGLVDYCYGGFPVFRAFAEASTIVKYSEASEAYQRIPDDKHVNDIKKFIIEGQDVYTPEVTLAYSISDWFNSEINPVFCGGMTCGGSLEPMVFLTDGAEDYLVNLPPQLPIVLKDSVGIRFSKNRKNNLVTLTLPDNLKKKPFKRIDGNHRLEAFEQLTDKIARDTIPVSILLLTNYYESEARETEMAIFHNINAKAKPLTQIEQYRGFLNLFKADELRKFGKEFAVTKDFLDNHDKLPLENLNAFFTEKDDMVLKCVKFLFEYKKEITANELADILTKLNNIYFADNEKLRSCANRSALLPFVYFHFTNQNPKVKLDTYTTWFINNKLYDLKDFDPASIIEIFERIFEIRRKQIFVAMPFIDSLNFVFNTITEVVNKINRENEGLELPLPVRIDKQIIGFSYDIVEEIFSKIENAGLLIADLTDQNANVYYEAGFAQGLIRSKFGDSLKILYLISNPQNPDKPFAEAKFDVNHYKVISYRNDGNSVNILKDNLEKEFKVFYGIS
jgi:hypothetical protein